ncbi:MAG: ABC transporter permease [Butyrivibrio sp.]|nr:ABC transporter permease [Butyrivibrio sp.]
MNKSDFAGFKQVFIFEFITGIKKTGFKVFLAILCAMSFLTTPIILILGNLKSGENIENNILEKTVIESVYIYDETGLSMDYDILNKIDKYTETKFITDNEMSYTEAVDELKEKSDLRNLVIKVEYDSNEGFNITIARSSKSGIKKEVIEDFEEDYLDFYREEVLKNLKVSEEDYEYISKDIDITIMKANEDGTFSEDAGKISTNDYFIMLAGLMIVFIFINMSVGNIATSIATEKSSRVIEYLLTGTRPLALLSGKIVARILESLITIFATYSCFFMSQLLSVFIAMDSMATSSTSGNMIVVSSVWETITISKLIVVILYFIAGITLYSIIGALTGASVSKLDELQDAYKYYNFILVGCVYVDMFLIIMMLTSSETGAFQTFCAVFPLTGAFLTPALILLGKISILTGIIALAVMVITVAITFILAAAVYESMLLFQGRRIKVKDIITIMKKQVIA